MNIKSYSIFDTPRKIKHRTWKWWFGRWCSFSRGLFSGSMWFTLMNMCMFILIPHPGPLTSDCRRVKEPLLHYRCHPGQRSWRLPRRQVQSAKVVFSMCEWFQRFFVFTPTWGNGRIWLIFSDGLKPPTSVGVILRGSSQDLQALTEPMEVSPLKKTRVESWPYLEDHPMTWFSG